MIMALPGLFFLLPFLSLFLPPLSFSRCLRKVVAFLANDIYIVIDKVFVVFKKTRYIR